MDSTDKPREIVIHQSANRPNLLVGGDRELVLITMMVSAGLAFSLAPLWGIGWAVLFWIGSMAALQRMGKADPLLRHVYLRHIRYTAYYPAKSGLHGQNTETPANWR